MGFGDTPIGLVSQILNLGAVLTRKGGLQVPRYQRPYTWTEREVRELIRDLWGAFERGAPFYFIGQIVLIKNTRGKFEISDGQQRLATTTMLMAYTRDRLPGRAKHYQQLILDGANARLLLRQEDSGFFHDYVQEAGHMSALARDNEPRSDSKELIAAAARTIESELKEVGDRELDAFMSYVARSCTLNVVDADERGCAQTVFNTLNKRGSPLSGADILKSDLIENSKFSEQEATAAAQKWEQIEDMFEREHFALLLGMMPFLLAGERLLSPGDLAAFRAAVERTGGVKTFLFDQLPRYAAALRAILANAIDVGPASAEVNRRVRLMQQVKDLDWMPAAIAFLAEHSGEHERARRFFQALDRFTFACELSVVDNRQQQNRYARAVKHAGDDKMLYGPKGALELTEKEQMAFFATLNRSRKRDRQRRLLMMRLEAAMPNGNMLQMTDDVTVEHVLPRAGGPYWNERFFDKMRRTEAAHLLGNLVLVTHTQNTLADTKPYPEKRKIFFNTPGAPIHQVTRDIVGIEEWTLNAIEERHERLVRILCEDWGLVRSDTSQAA
ncbi:MAG TPA: DUF262 domain-containing HNH endonuclease family protein [Candidatus Binatia bacterium]|nr:DUF262 domain-containing HNH endonuclease family protein [Candidatus Binatia bacterium]